MDTVFITDTVQVVAATTEPYSAVGAVCITIMVMGFIYFAYKAITTDIKR